MGTKSALHPTRRFVPRDGLLEVRLNVVDSCYKRHAWHRFAMVGRVVRTVATHVPRLRGIAWSCHPRLTLPHVDVRLRAAAFLGAATDLSSGGKIVRNKK